MPNTEHTALVDAMKKAAGAMRDADVPFVLAGGLACWARGAPQTDHDVDFFLKPEDAEDALKALAKAGMRTEKPPEGWLYKAYSGDAMIDLIFNPSGGPVTDEILERGDELEVMAMPLRVASLEDVMVTKLLSLREQEPDYSSVLQIARALREQIDWEQVRERTQESPFARAFFTMIEGIGIIGDGEPADAGGRTEVRVVEPSR